MKINTYFSKANMSQNNLFGFFLATKALYGLIFMLAEDASKVVVLGGIR